MVASHGGNTSMGAWILSLFSEKVKKMKKMEERESGAEERERE